MRKPYLDMYGDEIKAGMLIQNFLDRTTEIVCECGEDDLGVNATNPDCPYLYGDEFYYPLSQFSTSREWFIVRVSAEDDSKKVGE